MKRLFRMILVTVLSFGVADCVSSKSSDQNANATPQSSSDKLLGMFDLKDIFTLKFEFTAGMTLVKPPQITVTFSDGLPSSASIQIFDQNNNLKCNNVVAIDSTLARQLVNAAMPLNLGVVPQSLSVAVDCGQAWLDIEMKDSSSHSYKFNSICSAPGELNIFDPQDTFSTKIADLITANGTCP